MRDPQPASAPAPHPGPHHPARPPTATPAPHHPARRRTAPPGIPQRPRSATPPLCNALRLRTALRPRAAPGILQRPRSATPFGSAPPPVPLPGRVSPRPPRRPLGQAPGALPGEGTAAPPHRLPHPDPTHPTPARPGGVGERVAVPLPDHLPGALPEGGAATGARATPPGAPPGGPGRTGARTAPVPVPGKAHRDSAAGAPRGGECGPCKRAPRCGRRLFQPLLTRSRVHRFTGRAAVETASNSGRGNPGMA